MPLDSNHQAFSKNWRNGIDVTTAIICSRPPAVKNDLIMLICRSRRLPAMLESMRSCVLQVAMTSQLASDITWSWPDSLDDATRFPNGNRKQQTISTLEGRENHWLFVVLFWNNSGSTVSKNRVVRNLEELEMRTRRTNELWLIVRKSSSGRNRDLKDLEDLQAGNKMKNSLKLMILKSFISKHRVLRNLEDLVIRTGTKNLLRLIIRKSGYIN